MLNIYCFDSSQVYFNIAIDLAITIYVLKNKKRHFIKLDLNLAAFAATISMKSFLKIVCHKADSLFHQVNRRFNVSRHLFMTKILFTLFVITISSLLLS